MKSFESRGRVSVVSHLALLATVAVAGAGLCATTYAGDALAQPAPPPPPPGDGFGGPAQPTGAAQPGMQPTGAPPAQPGGGFNGGVNGGFNPNGGFNGGTNGGFTPVGPGGPQPTQPTPPKVEDKDAEWKARVESLTAQTNLYGTTGMLHTTFAGAGVAGTFRVGFLFDWMKSDGFLCDQSVFTPANAAVTCNRQNGDDSASHVGGIFSLSVTPFSFLEAYASIKTYANSNDQGSPQLLQVLGDTTIGVKGYTPAKFLGPISAGLDLELLLLNGTGDVGLSGGSTSARITALGTVDLRNLKNKSIPFRANLNLGYKIDNSGVAVEDVEAARKKPITRVERFGLGISKVDYFQMGLGVDVPFWFMQPYIEWTLDVPVNRQGYRCRTDTISRGDVCLGLEDLSNPNGDGAGFPYIPSRLTIGAKVSPFKSGAFRGLSGHLAFDIGTSGMNRFIEEVAPEAPWMMHIGLGYAFDVKEKPVVKSEPLPAPPPVQIPAPENLIRGFVHEKDKQDPVANAIVAFSGAIQPPFATGPDGRFLSRNIQPGSYTFEISAPGYKPGTCQVTVNPPMQPMQPMQPQFGMPGQPGQPGQPGGGQFGGPAAPPPVPQGPNFSDADCALEALARTGSVSGTVKDSEGAVVGGAQLTITDALGKEQKTNSGSDGTFKLENLQPGEITIKAEANNYMNHVESKTIRASEVTPANMIMNKKPKNPLVRIEGNELKLGDKVLFENDSSKIMGQSSALLEEVADVMMKNPNIEQIEVQGHTDNNGAPEHNQTLSDDRANSVRDWLVKAGIKPGRMVAKGYGQTKPLVPNVTDANKAKNRRVQFIILKKTGG